MLLINGDNYPRYIGDLQAEHSGWQEGDALPDGWSQVQEVEQPLPEIGKKVVEESPKLYRGKYKQVWTQVDLSVEDQGIIAQQEAAMALMNRLNISEADLLAIKTIIV